MTTPIWTPDPDAHKAGAVRARLAALNEWEAATAKVMSEDALLSKVRQECRLLGLLCYHTHNSQRSEAGFPDLVIAGVRSRRLLYVELKRENGQVKPAQDMWLTTLSACGEQVRVWRPSDQVSGRIARELGALAAKEVAA